MTDQNNDNAMDLVARDLIDLTMRYDPAAAIIGGNPKHTKQDEIWNNTLMAEAHKAGDKVLMARLLAQPGDIKEVEPTERMTRIIRAMNYATSWQLRRGKE
ncbi:hypothetical protein [Sphingomonas sp. M1A8_2b]